MTTDDPKLAGYRALFEKLEDPFVLYLALLMHDTGKASARGRIPRRARSSRNEPPPASSSRRSNASR
jgi:hypothetical protein